MAPQCAERAAGRRLPGPSQATDEGRLRRREATQAIRGMATTGTPTNQIVQCAGRRGKLVPAVLRGRAE